MTSDAINIWYNPEDIQRGKDTRIFVGIKARGNMMLRHDGYDLILFLTQTEADSLSFQLGNTLQEIEITKKEAGKE